MYKKARSGFERVQTPFCTGDPTTDTALTRRIYTSVTDAAAIRSSSVPIPRAYPRPLPPSSIPTSSNLQGYSRNTCGGTAILVSEKFPNLLILLKSPSFPSKLRLPRSSWYRYTTWISPLTHKNTFLLRVATPYTRQTLGPQN